MEAVHTNDGLFKIGADDISVRLIHVDGYISHVISLFSVDLTEIEVQVVLPSAGKDVQDPVVIEVIEDTGILTVFEVVQLGIDFIDTDGFRERDTWDMGVRIKDTSHSLGGDTGKFTDSFERDLGVLQQFHDAVDHLIGCFPVIRKDACLIGESSSADRAAVSSYFEEHLFVDDKVIVNNDLPLVEAV